MSPAVRVALFLIFTLLIDDSLAKHYSSLEREVKTALLGEELRELQHKVNEARHYDAVYRELEKSLERAVSEEPTIFKQPEERLLRIARMAARGFGRRR